MSREERMVSQSPDVRRCRFSLRLVLLRFCKDAKYFPRHLFLEDITLSPNQLPWGIGAHADVFRVESDTYGLLALKSGLLGLYEGRPESVFVVCRWMANGNVIQCMEMLEHDPQRIPRLHWVNFI